MMGAFGAWLLLDSLGLNYWVSLVVAPIIVATSASRSSTLWSAGATSSIPSMACCSHSELRWCSRGCSANASASPANPIRRRRNSREAKIPGLHVPTELSRVGAVRGPSRCVLRCGSCWSAPASAPSFAQRHKMRCSSAHSASTCPASSCSTYGLGAGLCGVRRGDGGAHNACQFDDGLEHRDRRFRSRRRGRHGIFCSARS